MKKTLILRRHTVRNLTAANMGQAAGGVIYTDGCGDRTVDCVVVCGVTSAKDRPSEWVGKQFVAC
jgi:hypothetical protein